MSAEGRHMSDMRDRIKRAVDRLTDHHVEQLAAHLGLTQRDHSEDAGQPYRRRCSNCAANRSSFSCLTARRSSPPGYSHFRCRQPRRWRHG